MKRICNRKGISLIEVLTVLVLLLVGILSVIRLFPGGFLINQRTEAQTFATRLASQEMNRYANSVGNLMDAIVPIKPISTGTPPGYAFQIALDTQPDDLGKGTQLISGVDPYYYSDANKFRRVLGERVRIPIPSPTAAGKGSVYVLSSGPVYNVNWAGQTDSIFVSGAPLIRDLGDVSTDPRVSSSQRYVIDYDDHAIHFNVFPRDRQFLASYSYYDVNNRVQTIVDEVINVPANFYDWIPFAGNVNGSGQAVQPLVPDSDTVGRKFRQLTPVGGPYAWTPDDPYEYGFLSLNDGTYANVGVLLFNPLGHDYTEYTSAGPQPLTARIDYDVLDWHIIREDRPMPAASPYQVRLALKGLKQAGDVQDDQSIYTGIFRDPASSQVDMLVYDLGTGVPVPKSEYTVNYRDGSVTFTDAFGNANAAGNYRFFYQAKGEWALQSHKAFQNYRFTPVANVGAGQFYLPMGANPGQPSRMYFPLMDAGKSISIRQFWYQDGGNVSHQVNNETFRINSNPANFEVLGGQTLTWVDMADTHPDFARWDPAPIGQAALGVQGVSFRSRVIWTNGGTVSDTPNGNLFQVRWRKVDLDTFLTRAGN